MKSRKDADGEQVIDTTFFKQLQRFGDCKIKKCSAENAAVMVQAQRALASRPKTASVADVMASLDKTDIVLALGRCNVAKCNRSILEALNALAPAFDKECKRAKGEACAVHQQVVSLLAQKPIDPEALILAFGAVTRYMMQQALIALRSGKP
jgi:hypothetical protein